MQGSETFVSLNSSLESKTRKKKKHGKSSTSVLCRSNPRANLRGIHAVMRGIVAAILVQMQPGKPSRTVLLSLDKSRHAVRTWGSSVRG